MKKLILIAIAVLVLIVAGVFMYGIRENTEALLTQEQAQNLVHTTWGDCSQGNCADVEVSVTQQETGQYVVTAIFTELDDSTSHTKKVSRASFQNGTWMLSEPIVTRACHRGHVDGSKGFTSAFCI